MKVKVVVYELEGFMTHVGLHLENGLSLVNFTKGNNLAWAGRDKKLEVIGQLKSFLDELAASGWEVTGLELLEDN